MATLTTRTVRLYSNHLATPGSSPASVQLACPTANALDIEFGAFDQSEVNTKIVPWDLTGVDSLRFQARNAADALIMDKIVLAAAFTSTSLTVAAWNNGSSQHAVFQFSDAETNLTPGTYTYSIYAELSTGDTVTLVTDTIIIWDDISQAAGGPPDLIETYLQITATPPIADGEVFVWDTGTGTAINQTLAEAGIAAAGHAADHVTGGADEIDGDHLDIDFTPSNYTPSIAPAEASNLDHLAAHLQGIDTALAAAGASFLGLSDTPGSFAGQGGQVVAVNVGETALEFISPGGGGGGMVTGISKNSGANVNAANRSVLNFIEGTNIALTITDDAGGDEVDITVAVSGLQIGVDVQAWDTDLDTWATKTPPSGVVVGDTDTQTLTGKTLNDFTNDIHADDVHVEVRNESGGVINKGEVVYVSGFSIGQSKTLVSKADASAAATMPALGVSNENISNNADGEVIEHGKVEGIDTSLWSEGDVLYVSETAGGLTNVKPTGSALVQEVGEVLRSHATLGVVEVQLQTVPYVTGFAATLLDDPDQSTAQTTLGVDPAGTDNSTNVTIAVGLDYVTISGQELTLNAVDLTTDVTGDLPYANLTAAGSASKLLGRGDSGAGDWQEITIGSGLSMTGTTLAATGGGMVTGISKNSGANVNAANRSVLNFIEGSNVSLTITDDVGGDEVDITVATSTSVVTKVGTPADNQIGVWTGDGTIEGSTSFTYDDSNDTFNVGGLNDGTIRVGGDTILNNNAGSVELTNISSIDAATANAFEATMSHNDLQNYVANEHIDWTSTSSNLDTTGTVAAANFLLDDTNGTHTLTIDWSEDETVGNRTLDFKVNAANRTIDLSGNLTVSAAATVSGTNTGDVTKSGTPDYVSLSGQDIVVAQVDLTTDITGDLPFANFTQATAASKLLGRGSAGGAGDYEEITIGSGLTMTGTTLSSSGGGGMVTGISKNSGANVNAANRSVLNFIEGSNITLTITDDAGGDEVDITIASSAGGGNVSNTGTPVDGQIAVWTDATTIEGDAALSFDTTTDTLSVGATNDGTMQIGGTTWLNNNAGSIEMTNIGSIDAATANAFEASIQHNDLQGVSANEHIDWTSTNNALATTGTGSFSEVLIEDNDGSHFLTINWNEAEATLGRTLNFVMNGSDRTIDLSANLTVSNTADVSGTNTGDVTFAGTPDYLTLSGQEITLGQIDLATDITGDLPYANLTAATAASRILGRGSAGGAGDWQEITLGSGLAMSGTSMIVQDLAADTVDAIGEIASAIKAGTGTSLVTNANDASVPIYTEQHATSHTISAAECYGGVHYATAAATITLPAVAAGMSVTVITAAAVAVSVKPNASDLIRLDGTALDDADKITNSSTAGDAVTLTYYDATGWHATTDGNWTDTGA